MYEVKCSRGNYGEVTLWEWITRFLKGKVSDTIQYLGEDASVSIILEKLETVYGAVASYDILMKRFYHLSQDKGRDCFRLFDLR